MKLRAGTATPSTSAVLESTDSRLYFHLLPYFVLRLYLASLVCPFNSFTLSNA